MGRKGREGKHDRYIDKTAKDSSKSAPECVFTQSRRLMVSFLCRTSVEYIRPNFL